LYTSNSKDNCGNGILRALVLNGSLQFLESRIKNEKSFVFLSNAGKKGKDINVSTISLDDSLFDLGKLNSVWRGSKLDSRLRTKDGLSSGHTNIFTKLLPVSVVVLGDRVFDFGEDIFTVDHEILTNMVSEGRWATEDLSHLSKLFPVSLEVRAVGHALLNSLQDVGNLLDTINYLRNILGLEVLDGFLGIGEDVLSIGDACVDVLESFGIESSLEHTSDNSLELLDVNTLFWSDNFWFWVKVVFSGIAQLSEEFLSIL